MHRKYIQKTVDLAYTNQLTNLANAVSEVKKKEYYGGGNMERDTGRLTRSQFVERVRDVWLLLLILFLVLEVVESSLWMKTVSQQIHAFKKQQLDEYSK